MISQGSERAALIIFVRFPAPGKVKLRLAKGLGAEEAASFYRACAGKLFQESKKVGGSPEKYIFYSDPADEEAIRQWAGAGFHFEPQQGENLGERLKNALRKVFAAGAKRAVVVASDTPDLSAGILEEALGSLSTYNIVIGPTLDGGYYLLGMRMLHEDLFKRISWSTKHVLGQTVEAGRRLGLSVKLLPCLRDIDTAEDLVTWYSTAGAGTSLAEFLK